MTSNPRAGTGKGKLSGLLWLLLSLAAFCLLSCAQETLVRGQYFPELANPSGGCTFLLFFTENLEYYESERDYFGGLNSIDYLIKRLQMDLTQLSGKYPDLRIIAIDVYQNRNLAIDHRVDQIPTVLVFSASGHEIRRWTPDDLRRGGGTMLEMERVLGAIGD